MSRLTGKIALVTGASKGIGAGIAKNLCAEGAAVVVNYATSREGADRTVAEIVKGGGRAWAVQGDFSKSAEITRTFAEIEKKHGKLDVLVNNAGGGRVWTTGERDGGGVPPAVRSECAGTTAVDTGGREADGSGRIDDQYRVVGGFDADGVRFLSSSSPGLPWNRSEAKCLR
jgi:NAD(P)-dependent dehydrogenase (short-subunit alcohol dehydrogenase family)